MDPCNDCKNEIKKSDDIEKWYCRGCLAGMKLTRPFPRHVPTHDRLGGVTTPEGLKIWNRNLKGFDLVEPYSNCINLGCGNIIIKDFMNVDYVNRPGVHRVNLFDPPWRIPHNQFGYILASQVMEHIPHVFCGHPGEGFFLFMKEVFKIATDGAIFEVQVPNPFYFKYAFICNGHTRLVNANCFRTWHMKGISTDGERTDAEGYGTLEPLRKCYTREFKLGPISDVHFRKYLGMELGLAKTLVLVFRIHKGDADD